MGDESQIRASSKVGLNAKEGYIVTRGNVSYLRILGGEPTYELMTATADEDNCQFRVCKHQSRLLEAALRLGAEIVTGPKVEADRFGREYVKICGIQADPDRDREAFDREITRLLKRFFALFGEYEPPAARKAGEMCELYEVLSTSNDGGGVYLSDGLWLSSDGTVQDRGR